MLTRSNIHRSISKMTLDLNRASQARRHRADDYGLAEREYQAQYDFTGHIGLLPGEADIEINFTVAFVADPGNQRDSTLDRPHSKLTIEMLFNPPGTVPYVYISDWKRDDDFNYIGALVKVGIHMPALAIAGQLPALARFHGILHASFQGFGTPLDGDAQPDATTSNGEEMF